MEVTVDGVKIYYEEVGPKENYPMILLHGGPGLDHSEMHPWLDALGERFRLLYVDQRGQGKSERVDPQTLTLERWAKDITGIAAALQLEDYAVLGHSFGSFVTLYHAIYEGGASHYIVSGGSANMTKSMTEVEENLKKFEPVELREQVKKSWELEAEVKTQEDCAEVMRMQYPFHFKDLDNPGAKKMMSEDHTVYSPEVLSYTAKNGYSFDVEDDLYKVNKPTLLITGEYDNVCSPRANQEMHEGIHGSELYIVQDAGHMTYVEKPDVYLNELNRFFDKHPVTQK